MDIFSQETIIFLQIILVNVILSGDNAIVIGMVASIIILIGLTHYNNKHSNESKSSILPSLLSA